MTVVLKVILEIIALRGASLTVHSPRTRRLQQSTRGRQKRRELVENLRYDGESSDRYDEKEDVKNPRWQPQDTEDSSHL